MTVTDLVFEERNGRSSSFGIACLFLSSAVLSRGNIYLVLCVLLFILHFLLLYFVFSILIFFFLVFHFLFVFIGLYFIIPFLWIGSYFLYLFSFIILSFLFLISLCSSFSIFCFWMKIFSLVS